MNRWPIDVGGYTKDEFEVYCNQDAEWQVFTGNMTSYPTADKLTMLHNWYEARIDRNPRRTKVQVDSYINALKRSGHLKAASLEVFS